jgi:hypothetical protein
MNNRAATNEANRRATVYLVEANDFTTIRLWLEWAEEGAGEGWSSPFRRVPWQQIALGYTRIIGELAGMPVAVCVSFARIKGHVAAFYEATSEVVDHRMIEAWLESEFPAARGRTDAMNFHRCLEALDLLSWRFIGA